MLVTNMFAAKYFGAAAEANILSAVAAVTAGAAVRYHPAPTCLYNSALVLSGARSRSLQDVDTRRICS